MRTFETEYQLQEWRKIESEHFDSNGNAYTGQTMDRSTQEQMRTLINQLDSELKIIEESWGTEKNVFNQVDRMCVESLPPHEFENWERIKCFLKSVRKNLV